VNLAVHFRARHGRGPRPSRSPPRRFAVEPDQALLAQEVVGFVHGVEVDPKSAGAPGGAMESALGQYAIADFASRSGPETLLVDRTSLARFDVVGHHEINRLVL